MADYAIIIGIDAYKNPAWNLQNAVADATRFLDWALTTAKVPAGNVQMFLSPLPAGGLLKTPHASEPIRVRVAERDEIFRFIVRDMIGRGSTPGWGEDGRRLWVYFAGHGCSHPNARGDKRAEPLLFPADMEDLFVDSNKPIGFSELLEPLRSCGPREQIFFIDACRDFALENIVYASAPGMQRYLRPPLRGPRRNQFMIYATGPGRTAEETRGAGVFSSDLLKCLGPAAAGKRRVAGIGNYVLTFEDLFKYLRRAVTRRLEALGKPADEQDPTVQIPERDPEPSADEPVLGAWEEDEIEPSVLQVRVRPGGARPAAKVTVYYESHLIDEPPNEPKGPPVETVVEFKLKPSYFQVNVRAAGFRSQSPFVEVPPETPLDVRLEPLGPGDEPEPPEKSPTPTRGGGKAAVGRDLLFFSQDTYARLTVWDPGKNPHTGLGEVRINGPLPGVYRAEVGLPEGGGASEYFEYPACGPLVEVNPQRPGIGQAQANDLARHGLFTDGPYQMPSETLGNIANLPLTSYLAFAAYASIAGPAEAMHRLRALQVPHPPADDSDQAWLTVIVAATGDRLGGYDPADVLRQREIVLRSFAQDDEAAYALEPMAEFPNAAVVQTVCPPGGMAVKLTLPGLPPLWHAAAALRGRSTVLVLGVDERGGVTSQCYSLSLDRDQQFTFGPSEMRRAEQAQRFYAGREIVPAEIRTDLFRDLLHMKITEPVVGCLAGYLMLRYQHAEEYRGRLSARHEGDWDHPSPMQNMIRFYPSLPDVYVLAALADPGRADDYFQAASELGPPLFTEGFQALLDWYRRTDRPPPPALQQVARRLNPGMAFSTWQAEEPGDGKASAVSVTAPAELAGVPA